MRNQPRRFLLYLEEETSELPVAASAADEDGSIISGISHDASITSCLIVRRVNKGGKELPFRSILALRK